MEIDYGKKVFRSLLKKYFPIELMIKLDEITMSHDIDNNSKTPEIIALLKEYNVPFSPLGNGTNRYGILTDGYAVKIALDRMGKTDNKREFKYSKRLYPSVVKVYECLSTGLLAVFEYITIFSMADFYDNQVEMREILKEISQNFLIGDIGISTNNYVNWGLRSDGSIAILDFAYIYSLSYRGFVCSCEDEGVLQFDNDFNFLICPYCRKKWSFSDIRKRISKQDEINEIGNILECGYILDKQEQELSIDPDKSPVKKPKVKKKREPNVPKRDKQNWDIDSATQEDMLNKINNIVGGTNYGKEK